MISNYVEFSTGNKTYKLRLNTRNVVNLERQLGCNPLAVFGDGNTIPTITTMVQILYASMQQYEHGISLDNAFDIFDEWLNEGHVMTDFLAIIIDIYKTSGIITKGKTDEKN